ncbi:MAG TPA: carbon-nitrogen hydrolase family protein [Glaciihabitans sp.]|jgi:predicted amidohydrolase|nr:carbon-nitrogen hydrolase family protein [Glaciihabitans sp.]
MSELIAVATAQFSAVANISANLDTIRLLARDAAGRGARVIVFPEAAMYKQHAEPTALPIQDVAQNTDGPFATALAELATELGTVLVVGMATPGGDKAHNVIVVIEPGRGVTHTYDKIHLFDSAKGKESDRYFPATLTSDLSSLVTFTVDGLTFGVTNCYDLRFPELYRALVDQGAEVLLVPAAWVDGPGKAMHWEVLLRARAIENTSYVVGAGQSPPMGAGYSLIVDPYGVGLAASTETAGISLAWLDPQRVTDARTAMPILANRRFGVHPLVEA